MQSNIQYIIYKTIGHFYYVKNFSLESGFTNELSETVTFPSRLKKEGIDIYVGDLVLINKQDKTIKEVLPRKSLLSKPKIANIDLILIVFSITEPEPDWEHLDRLIFLAEISTHNKPILCLSKIDLKQAELLELEIYKNLGYEIFPICNITGQGIEELQQRISGYFCTVAGKSGVGKSSLLNTLCPELKLKTGLVSNKLKTGMHTTRYTEIHQLKINNKSFICDTPGFSRTNIEYTVQEILSKRPFAELSQNTQCSFPDCKHIDEEGCNVKFTPRRYNSYKQILTEAIEWENTTLVNKKYKNSLNKTKQDSLTNIPLLEKKQRSASRKFDKQNITNFIPSSEEES